MTFDIREMDQHGDFEVTTKNRFQILQGRENYSTMISSENYNTYDNDVARQDFANGSIDTKLNYIFDELKHISKEQMSCNRKMANVEKALTGMNVKVNQVIQTTNRQTDFMKALAYKSIDIEARSRRNNLIFRGLSENKGENCFMLIRDFLNNHLDIDPRQIYLARAHRLGRFDPRQQVQRRPIIVNFRDFCDTELIMNHVTMLKGKPFSVDYDLPREIQEARARLWSQYKLIKRDAPQSKVQIVYPAKLIQDGKLIRDEMPDWNKYTKISRLSQIHYIESDINMAQDQQCIHDAMNMVNTNAGDARANDVNYTSSLPCAQQSSTTERLQPSFLHQQYSLPFQSSQIPHPIVHQQPINQSYMIPAMHMYPETMSGISRETNPNSANRSLSNSLNTNSYMGPMETNITDNPDSHTNSSSHIQNIPNDAPQFQPTSFPMLSPVISISNTQSQHKNVQLQNCCQFGNDISHPKEELNT